MRLKKTKDRILLRRAVHLQDKQALGALYRKYSARIERYIASRVSCAADVQDLTQNVFLQLLQGNGQYNKRMGCEAYIFGIVRNILYEYYRKKEKLLQTIPLESAGGIVAEPDVQSAQAHLTVRDKVSPVKLQSAVDRVISQMPYKHRQVLELRFSRGLSSKDAAKKAGCSVNAFYKRLCKAVGCLQELTDEVSGRHMDKSPTQYQRKK